MPAPGISITEEGYGAARFQARIRAFEHNLAAQAVASKVVMGELERYTAQRWGVGESVTQATEERWPDWQPLENTGALKGSLTSSSTAGAVREITPYGFRWGTNLVYAKFLQAGTRKMRPHPPVQSLRALRAVVGWSMRKFILRNVGPSGL